ncbi:MAG: hypothetical protein ACO4CZ_13530 [Planctomycetota bacterium]
MAAAKNPLQTLSRRAGNYAPKAAPSPSLLGAPEPTDGAKGRRGGIRSGTAQGGRAATSARQGQLPFGVAEPRQETEALQVTGALQVTEALQVAEAPQERDEGSIRQPAAETEQAAEGSAKRVLARETVVIRRRTVVVERASGQGAASAAGLRSPAKPALRRIVLAEVDAKGGVAVSAPGTVSAAHTVSTANEGRAVVTRESLPTPRRDIPIVLEAVGTVAITVLGLAALFFLG